MCLNWRYILSKIIVNLYHLPKYDFNYCYKFLVYIFDILRYITCLVLYWWMLDAG